MSDPHVAVPGTPSSPPRGHRRGAPSSADCLAEEGRGVATLQYPEPSFYIPDGRNTTFLMRVEQVDEIFAPPTAEPAAAGASR